MNPYQPPTPRAAFVFAALVMTALCLGMLVGVPAASLSASARYMTPSAMAASPTAVVPAVTEVTVIPSTINVVGVRGTNPTALEDRNWPRAHKPEV
jgi:hypothetical protein